MTNKSNKSRDHEKRVRRMHCRANFVANPNPCSYTHTSQYWCGKPTEAYYQWPRAMYIYVQIECHTVWAFHAKLLCMFHMPRTQWLDGNSWDLYASKSLSTLFYIILCTCMYVQKYCKPMYIYKSICLYIYIYMFILYIHTYIYVHSGIYIYIHVYVYIYIYLRIC